MSRTNKLGKTATTVTQGPDGLCVTYHQTNVVMVNKHGRITLDTGGWNSVTTKLRMNQASNQFGLGYQVYQNKGRWFVRLGRWNEKPSHPDLAFEGRTISFKVVRP